MAETNAREQKDCEILGLDGKETGEKMEDSKDYSEANDAVQGGLIKSILLCEVIPATTEEEKKNQEETHEEKTSLADSHVNGNVENVLPPPAVELNDPNESEEIMDEKGSIIKLNLTSESSSTTPIDEEVGNKEENMEDAGEKSLGHREINEGEDSRDNKLAWRTITNKTLK